MTRHTSKPNKLRNVNPVRGRTGNVTTQKWNIYKEPIATGTIINCCNFFMKLDKTFKRNCIHKPWVIIGQAG